jgi:hypothetical protein
LPQRGWIRHWGCAATLVCALLLITACGGAAPGATVVATLNVAPTATIPPPTPTTAATTTTAAANLPPTPTAVPPTRTPLPPTATPLPIMVEARNVATTKNTSGQFLIIGEFVNLGQGDIGELKVLVSVLDGTGKTIAAPTAVLALEALGPGEKTVWQATVTEKLDAIGEVRAQAQAARLATSVRDRLYKDLKVAGVSFSSQTGQQPTVWVNGQVTNTGSNSASVGVWIAAYAADGKLTHVTLDSSTRLYQVPAAQEQPFQIALPGLSEPPARYEFWLRGNKREASFSAQVVELPTQKVNVVKSAGAAPVVFGEITNPGQAEVASFNLVISFLDDAGKTVGVGGGSLASNLLAPGERTVWRSVFFSGMTDKTAYKEVRVQAQAMVAGDSIKRQSARNLRVEGETIAPSGGAGSYLRVNGQVVNSGNQPTQTVSVTIAVYGADGTLLLIERAAPQTQQIPAGGSAPFTMNLITVREPPAKYEFFFAATKTE